MMTDPIADMLTRIRNANNIYMSRVDFPYSKLKEAITKKLKQEGYIQDYRIQEKTPHSTITVYLKYGPDGEKIIQEIRRVSRPGCRVYRSIKELRPIIAGLGISIVSTSKGILTDRECREQKVGGEVICTVW